MRAPGSEDDVWVVVFLKEGEVVGMLLLGRSSMFMDMVRPSMPVKLKNRRNNGRRVAPEAAMSPSPGSEVDHCGGC